MAGWLRFSKKRTSRKHVLPFHISVSAILRFLHACLSNICVVFFICWVVGCNVLRPLFDTWWIDRHQLSMQRLTMISKQRAHDAEFRRIDKKDTCQSVIILIHIVGATHPHSVINMMSLQLCKRSLQAFIFHYLQAVVWNLDETSKHMLTPSDFGDCELGISPLIFALLTDITRTLTIYLSNCTPFSPRNLMRFPISLSKTDQVGDRFASPRIDTRKIKIPRKNQQSVFYERYALERLFKLSLRIRGEPNEHRLEWHSFNVQKLCFPSFTESMR